MIDTLVKISQILIPVALTGAGWLVARSQVKFTNKLKQKTDFEQKWKSSFYETCLRFSDEYAELLSILFDNEINKKVEKIKYSIEIVRREQYKLRVFAASLDGAEDIVRISDSLLSEMKKLIDNLGGETDHMMKLHSELIGEVRRFAGKED